MNLKEFWSNDFRSSIIVFLVALPLCLGIALASGAPLFSGLIAGIIGGIVVGSLSGSPLSVSGPAAGLTTIVAATITQLGTYPAFLFAVVVAGVFQIIIGFVRAGAIGHFFPSSVIKGMMAGIGLILVLKQIPHAVGYDADFEGDEVFVQPDGQNTITEIAQALESLSAGSIVIAVLSILLLLSWESKLLQRSKFFQLIPAPLGVVALGILFATFFNNYIPALSINAKHMVNVPLLSENDWSAFITTPDFSMWRNPAIYRAAFTIAIIASLETLLSIEACDKMDPFRRITPLNQELRAQGSANIISGLLGGLPVTSVIVRSSANINSGARTKASAISHGIILLIAVLAAPKILALIPLSCLAGILIMVGFKLTHPVFYTTMYRKGPSQFLPFMTTVLAIASTNLLQGVFMGILVAVFFILQTNFTEAIIMVNEGSNYLIKTTKDVLFLHKGVLRSRLRMVPRDSFLTIDGSASTFIDMDIKETIHDFIKEGKAKNITVNLKKISPKI